MYQTQCIQVANVVRVFAQQVKQIIHDNTFDYVFEVGENSMWNSSEFVGLGFSFTWI